MPASKLEDALLRARGGKFRVTLFGYLDAVSLGHLRCVSRRLRILEPLNRAVFHHIYVKSPLPGNDDSTDLSELAGFCQSLTIIVDGAKTTKYEQPSSLSIPKKTHQTFVRRSLQIFQHRLSQELHPNGHRPESSSPVPSLSYSVPSASSSTGDGKTSVSPTLRASSELRDPESNRSQWINLLSHFQRLTSLTLRVYGNKAWPGCTNVEQTLVDIRIAIEHAKIPDLRNFSLSPIHAMGIMHLQWSGLNAFNESLASSAQTWQRIERLDLRICTLALTEDRDAQGMRRIMFNKQLYNYLRSFASTLRCLRFVWAGAEGPSPLTLHVEPGLEGRQPIKWYRLEQLWVGNITHPHRTIRLIHDLAPQVTVAKTLRSTHTGSCADARDSSAWMSVSVPRTSLDAGAIVDRTSSVYSQSTSAGGISSTSRDIRDMPFLGDTKF